MRRASSSSGNTVSLWHARCVEEHDLVEVGVVDERDVLVALPVEVPKDNLGVLRELVELVDEFDDLHGDILTRKEQKRVDAGGVEPPSPVRETGALPLSYTSVGVEGVEPPTSCASCRRSSAELHALCSPVREL